MLFCLFSTVAPPGVMDMTTAPRMKNSNNTTLIVIIIVLIILVILLVLFMIIRKRRRAAAAARAKLMTEGHPHISIPTLGTHYELNSLLSINTVGRKGSHVSQVSEFRVDNGEKVGHL